MPKYMNTVKVTNRYDKRCLAKGLYIDNDTQKTGLNNNDLVIGSSGSSKTGSIVYTQLKMLENTSLVVADTKGRLHKMFRSELEGKGFKVRTLDFVNPENSCVYNPLDYVRKNKSGAYNELDIMKISHALIPDEMNGKDPFWSKNARAILEFFIGYCLEALPEEDHDMYTVCRLYRMFTKEMGESAFIYWIDEHPGSFVSNRYDEIKGMSTSEKTLASIYAYVNTALYPFDISDLDRIFSKNPNGHDDISAPTEAPDLDELGLDEVIYDDEYCLEEEELLDDSAYEDIDEEPAEELDIASLGKEKTVLFLNISDTDHSLDGLVNLFYTQTLQTLVADADSDDDGRLAIPCRIMFDDFAAGTVIPDFDKIISVVRSRDIWLTLCIQALSQLRSLYSEDQALTIMNNCDHIVYLAGNDINTAEFIGMRARKTPEAILAMNRAKEYVIEGGMMAVLYDKVPPYSYTKEDLTA